MEQARNKPRKHSGRSCDEQRKPRVYARTNQQPEDHTAGDDRPLHGEVGKIKNGIGDVVPHREDRIHKAIL